MSEARDQIFASLRSASPPKSRTNEIAERRDRAAFPWPAMPGNPVQIFRERVEQAGGAFETNAGKNWIAGNGWPFALGSAEHIYSESDALPSRGLGLRVPHGSLEQIEDRNEALCALAPLDLCVLRGAFGVVENGAVWHVPAHPAVRAAALLAEHLVLVVEENSLIPSLHHAYDRIQLEQSPFGWFLCGPSKTADIEQALVFGAHGPKTMRLILQTDK